MARLARNSNIRESELRLLHQDISRWALYCVDFNHDLAKETIQQTYLKIVEGTAQFSKKSTLKTWLYSVVRITAQEIKRKQGSHLASAGQESIDTLLAEEESTNAQDHFANAAVEEALGELSLMQREIIYLVFYRDMPLSEIAEILGVSIGTVRKQYHRAKNKLAGLLKTSEEEDKNGTFFEKSYT